jgi:hypothetical protein|tara:strand:- start:80 stop:430 length:351 start_codon:yes stop_codon:yes gene_type:complete
MASNYKIKNQYKNDTFDGVRFTVIASDTLLPIDLTNVSIKTQFRYRTETGKIEKTITDLDGITIEDAVNGIFKFDAFIVDWVADVYYYDVQFTYSNGVVKTYIKGTVKVIQDITNG